MRALLPTIALLLFLIILPDNSQGQQLSLDQLTALSEQDVDQINEYLASRGWAFDDAQQEGEEEVAHASWAYQKTASYYNNSSARAQAWLQINNPGPDQLLFYQTSNKLYYDALRTKIAAYKMERLGSSVVNGGIRTTYVGANFIISTSVRTSENNRRPVYVVLVQRKEAYLRQLLDQQDTSDDSEEAEPDLETTPISESRR
ncbi:hypothetical protein HNQ93_001452 [Hymenobacter luteus]|uniref:Uncharacterized protein n=2 Tax=Hymenobacter TaxID=89966 RepID=A0A7W9SZ64_9BACT|nr:MULTISPECIES: hypothetical protein [Hymenobacter]MBB4601187.1 hypothetical protein [Hymenobacter latericoloratus]MBB6058606.1 hypothetical protein [Hymenobacter luteus]